MRIVLAVVLLLWVLTCACSAQTLISDEARSRVFSDIDKIAASRQQRITGSRTTIVGPLSRDTKEVDLISVDPDLLSLMQGETSEYRQAVIEQLADADPVKRGIGCELLANTFDVVALQRLGALLDDTAPCIASRLGMPQSGPTTFALIESTVGETAAKAISAMTGMRFPNKAWFDIWWKANSRYEDKLWYWAARWKRESWPETIDGSPPMSLGVSRPDQSVVAADVNGRFSRLRPDAVLRILLLVRSMSALDNEIVISLGGTDKRTIVRDTGPMPWAGPDKQTMVDFITRHKLKGRLIELLCQRNLYPEAQTESAFSSLVGQISDLGSDVFAPGDESAIAQAQSVDKPCKAPVAALIILRSTIAPARAHTILREGLIQDPGMTGVARRLIEICEPQDQDILAKSFEVAQGWDRRYFAERVNDSAGKARGLDTSLVRRLVVLAPEPTAEDIAKHQYQPANCLCALARAANKLAGRDLVTEEDIKAATPSIGKRMPTDDDKTHNAALPDACRTLKTELLALMSP